MPNPHQHTGIHEQTQAQITAEQCWEEVVKDRLPAQLESQARVLKAFQRVRALPNAQALLRAMLSYVLSLCSLKQLSAWSRLVHVSTRLISPQGWNKRLQQSAPWLLWLVGELLELRLPTGQFPTQQRILLVDATCLNEMGPKGDLWRLHCSYDLLKGEMAWVQVTDRSVGESLTHVPIRPGDILVADKAYSKAPQLLSVQEAGAFSLTRLSPWHLPLYARHALWEKAEFRLDLENWLKALRPGTYERGALVISAGKRLPVRVIAVVLADEKAEALRQQQQKQARDKGRQLSEQSLFFAGFYLLVTTLPETLWPSSLVIALYQARWQIEILFKRIKQILETHRLPCRCPETAQAMIAAFLVAWLLIEEEASQLRREITDAEPLDWPLSSWQLNQWGKAALQQVVHGWWSPAQLRALAPELRRLYPRKGQRPLKEHQRQGFFHALLAGPPDLFSFFDCSSA